MREQWVEAAKESRAEGQALKPNSGGKNQCWVPKTREKATSPRANLQTSGLGFKRTGTENVL